MPLVVICHDDIEVSLPGGPATRRWARRRLGEVYRSASARLCISEAMEQTFRERYGAEGAVLPPIGDAVQTEPTEQRSGGIRIGCGGNVGGGNLAPLLAIADALGAVGGVLYITGATGGRDRERLSTHAAVRDDGFLPTADEMRAHFRESVDAMVVVQSFEPEDRSTVSLNFPSKLVEACAIGLPLLVVAPAGSSSAEWVRKAPGSAVLVESVSPELLAQGLERMRNPATRRDLKDGLVRRGSVEFGPDAIHGRLEAALAAAVAG